MAECLGRRSPIHAAALENVLDVVIHQVGIESGQHLLDGLAQGLAALDAEMLVQRHAVQLLHGTVGLQRAGRAAL